MLKSNLGHLEWRKSYVKVNVLKILRADSMIKKLRIRDSKGTPKQAWCETLLSLLVWYGQYGLTLSQFRKHNFLTNYPS